MSHPIFYFVDIGNRKFNKDGQIAPKTKKAFNLKAKNPINRIMVRNNPRLTVKFKQVVKS